MNEMSSALLSGALELPPTEREELATSLWDSLEFESGFPQTEDSEFKVETKKRRIEIFDGAVTTISHDELKRPSTSS